jgi:hypothetical protein
MKTLLNNTIYSEKITEFLSIEFEILQLARDWNRKEEDEAWAGVTLLVY